MSMELRCCEEGHFYHSALRTSCPFCLDTVWENHCPEVPDGNWESAIADCPDPEHTLLFVASYNISYQLKQEGEDYSLICRYRVGSTWRIVTCSMTLSAADYQLPEAGSIITESIAQIPGDDAGNSRLLINIGQEHFDHRWKWNPGLPDRAADDLMDRFHGLFRKKSQQLRSRMFRKNLLVNMSDGRVRCAIWYFQDHSWMVVEKDGVAAETILRPESVREICKVLSTCGLFEKGSKQFSEAEIDTTDMPIGVGCVQHVLKQPVVEYLVDCFLLYQDNP